jgi:hypothetical protein
MKNVASLDGASSPVAKREEPKAVPPAVPEREKVSFAVSSTGEGSPSREGPLAQPPPDSSDPFDPANLRLDPEYLKGGGVKKLLTTIPVRKPNKQDFIRVHPNPDYRLCGVAIVELREDRETYLMLPAYAQQLEPGTIDYCNLYLAINRQRVPFIWPVKLPKPDGREIAWHTSAREGAELAMRQWIRVTPNMSLGAYDLFEAQAKLSDPEWPELPLKALLAIAFKGRIIDGPNHPVMQRLNGII